MSLTSRKALRERLRRGREARARLVSNNLAEGIAFQIRATRDARGLNQSQFAEILGMTQGNLSRLEDPDYGKQTIASLKRVAEALDVALVVRFEPFSKYSNWLSGTPHVDEGLRPEALAIPSFEEEEVAGVSDQVSSLWVVKMTSPTIGASTGIEKLKTKEQLQQINQPRVNGPVLDITSLRKVTNSGKLLPIPSVIGSEYVSRKVS